MNSPWEYFSLDELKCKCGKCGSTGLEMEDGFMRKVIALRKKLNFPFIVTSAYRCAKYNSKVSTTGDSGPHTAGRAIDILIRGDAAYKLLKQALFDGFTGIGVSQKGISRFIHIDDLTPPEDPRPTIWSY